MPKRPLLLFPKPQPADRAKLSPNIRHIHKPDSIRQGQRLSPLFHQLQTAFEARRVEIQQSTTGLDPEQVLVIETIGSVENFANAVKHIEGLEWMGEIDCDEIAPDQDFYDEDDREKELNGRLYLVMTNQQALNEMVSLWRRFQDKPDMKFERGLTKFRKVFQYLKSIRRWDVQDRLRDTGVIDAWYEELKDGGDRVIPFEIELWFRGNNELRVMSMSVVTNLIQQAGGRILSQSEIESIAYHALLAELPACAIRSIVENQATELVKCENVMFFRPAGQMVVGDKSSKRNAEFAQIEEMPLPTGDPVVALFDGVPQANHPLLSGRLIIDDPDDWESDYTALERVHGSAMASLIVHGDLNQPQPPLSRPIYVRPIMKPLKWLATPRPEGIPENCLAVDLIHRAVKRLFEGDQEKSPIAPQIKVINLSIGDRTRQFTHSMSPLARLLDWLSVKYGVLFIVSAGNHSASISLDVSQEKFDVLQADELEEATIKALYRDARHRRLLSPAETINGISVGAVHFDDAQVINYGNRIDPFRHLLPSPISAFGSGYRRAIKPDIIFCGGRQLYRRALQPTPSVIIEPAIFCVAPGNKVASPGSPVGNLSATSYLCGTSNATALISRAAGICYDSLQQIFNEQGTEVDPSNYEVPLLKAMLIHGSSWGNVGTQISAVLRSSHDSRQLKGLISRWIGYGIPNVDRVLDCTEHRATVLGFGQLSNDEAHIFRLPLPPSLISRHEWRRLTVTLAWLSPISAKTQKYRTANLWFEINNTILTPTRSNADRKAVRRGTVQHEVFEGQRAEPFIDGEVLEIKVNCRNDAGKIQKPVAYGLVVSRATAFTFYCNHIINL
ncbi:MAG: S8 family peptidase [Desulfovibrio sp.]|nr:S8 family peptidase [Desulfovibrio sp.]